MMKKITYVSPSVEIIPLVPANILCGSQFTLNYGDPGLSGVFDDEAIVDGGSF